MNNCIWAPFYVLPAVTPALRAGPYTTPTALDTSFSTKEDTPLTQAAPGVLAGASDPDGGLLTAGVASPPLHGNLSLNSDGSFTYVPAANFNGGDGFNFTVTSSKNVSVVRRASITVGELSVSCA